MGTIEHLFLNSAKMNDFLNNLKNWLNSNCNYKKPSSILHKTQFESLYGHISNINVHSSVRTTYFQVQCIAFVKLRVGSILSKNISKELRYLCSTCPDTIM